LVEIPNAMDNRRQNYRHSLLPEVRLAVELTGPGHAKPAAGLTVNLSVGGMAAQFVDSGLALEQGEACVARVVIPGSQVDLSIPSMVVHQGGSSDAPAYGLRFLPVADPAANEWRETVIWRFLLEEQRRQRRHLLELARHAG
jgi:c-di-GMP-binding flagellar brake protein YcgR